MSRRDRHDRGIRGPLVPGSLPGAGTRATRFADLVVRAVDRLEPGWGRHLAAVDVAVVEVPAVGVAGAPVPLSAHRRGRDGAAPVIVLYRRPVELRAPDHLARVDLVRDLVAEELAALLGTAPDQLDPDYGGGV